MTKRFVVGDLVVRNPATWKPNAFDDWGRGEGVGVVVEPPFHMNDGEVDVRWPHGRCFETTDQLLPSQSIRDNREFWDLRDAPLHLYGPEEWTTYDPAMAAWLMHVDPEIRHCAIERLATATLHWDYEHSERAARKNQVSVSRVDWLLGELETAQRQWPDTIPEFLRNLRWHGDDPHIAPRLLRWIDAIASRPQPSADAGLIRGTQLLLVRGTAVTADQILHWTTLLDDASPYLRGCAAYRIGQVHDDDISEMEGAERLPTSQALWALIGEKEIQRPGIAGPYWSPTHADLSGLTPAALADASLWMMDLLERRQGPPPSFDEMPYNDIEFYLHELCCDSPEMMRRMLDGGFTELALMTATEITGAVEGVKPILETLAENPNAQIAAAARAHLGRYYGCEPQVS
jgi:hypothetical protein